MHTYQVSTTPSNNIATGSNIHLIPLLVLDDYQEGIPVAYAIFNWEDKVAISYTGVHIKLKCKGFKSCLWFMSDMAPQCFNS